MAGPYDYSINIPQPPAQNFLQSLMGIRQLQQMEQQSAIQQQQAGIQAQQAQFAQELQPLERQKLEAAIAAARAGTAQSMTSRDVALENLRQSKETFAQQEEMKKEEKLLRQDIIDVVKNPTSATQEKLLDISTRTAFLLPKSHEPLQKMFEDFPRAGKALENTASDVIFAVQSGQPNVAAASVDKSLKAAQNSLEINPNDKDAQATVSLLGGVKSLMDEKKYGEAMVSASVFLKNKNQKAWNAVTGDLQELGKATKAVAEAEKEQALTKKALGESATADVQIKDVFTKKLLKDSADKAKQYSEKADSALSILDKIDSGEVALPKSYIGNVIQGYRDEFPWFVNDITALRKDYIKLRNSEAIKNLPPGSASNQDVAFAKEGLLSEKANPKQFRKAVESMVRLNSLEATYQDAIASWVSKNGNIGDASREISILGTTVPKGTGFREWWKKSGSNLVSEQAGAPATSSTAPAGGVYTIDGFDMKIVPRKK